MSVVAESGPNLTLCFCSGGVFFVLFFVWLFCFSPSKSQSLVWALKISGAEHLLLCY